MTHEQVWLYLLIVPPGAAIFAAALGWWATKRSAARIDRMLKKGRI